MNRWLAAGILTLALRGRAAAAGYVAHEWGTFTTMHASDGGRLPGLEKEEASLPGFVLSHAGVAPANKGWDRPLRNVTVKMETPVLYFYAPREMTVDVAVEFAGGSISQWYPQRVSGETWPAPGTEAEAKAWPAVDFAAGLHGSAAWHIAVLAPDTPAVPSANKDWETPQWSRPRATGSNLLRASPGGEVEKFIFYRGLGNFAVPLEVRAEAGGLRLTNTGAEEISVAFVYEQTGVAVEGTVWWAGALPAGGTRDIARLAGGSRPSAAQVRTEILPAALMRAGLREDEARAMIATWRESYFAKPGLRVFWIVPRAFTDRVLPLRLTPAPDALERVMVGRAEILTPALESRLVAGFARDGGKDWQSDRYFAAYAARVAQLTAVPAQR